MDISIIIPLYNEEESLRELYLWIKSVLSKYNYSYEVIFVDDGSTDTSWDEVEKLTAREKNAKGICFRRNYGKSAALHTGFSHASGNVVITMDADLQDSPEEIPDLYRMIMVDGYHLVSGWKKKRYDPISKTIPSKFFNWTARVVSGIKLHDFNCGLKAYKGKVIKNIEVYGEMHRYIPLLAKQAGFNKIGEKVVQHQERKYGVSKFGLGRFVKGFLDLMSLSFISKFGKRPMHLFGTLGTLMFLIGGIGSAWIVGSKIYSQFNHLPWRDATEQPLFFVALMSVILGVQLFLTGFVAELVSRTASDRNKYQIEKTIAHRSRSHRPRPKTTRSNAKSAQAPKGEGQESGKPQLKPKKSSGSQEKKDNKPQGQKPPQERKQQKDNAAKQRQNPEKKHNKQDNKE